MVDSDGWDELVFGDMAVGFVFGKAGKINILGDDVTFEEWKIFEGESFSNL